MVEPNCSPHTEHPADTPRDELALAELCGVVELDAATLKRYTGSIASRTSQAQQDNEIARVAAETELVRTVLIETLRPVRGRYVGPALIVLGIAIGTVANICAL
jgi:hypothetical protein